jgi:hypothetical protein
MRQDETGVLFRQQIPRWIVASIVKYIQGKVSRFNTGEVLAILASELTPKAIRDNPNRIIIDFDGPEPQQLSDSCIRYWIDLNLVLTTCRNPKELYAHQKAYGVLVECFPACIPIYRYGNGSLDNDALLGVLQIYRDPSGFGGQGAEVDIQQSSLSAKYRLDYNED